MKKTIAIILTAAILLCAAPLAGFMAFDWSDISFENVFSVPAKAVTIIDSGSCGVVDEDNGLDGSQVTWTLDSEGTVRISGEGEMADYSELGGLDLEAPSPFAFMAGITSLIIEEGVTSIGTGAFFGCFNLSSVTIPDGVCRIGTSAFFYCLSLPEVTIPENVESIGTRAFAYCPGLVNIFVAENNSFWYLIVLIGQHIGQSIMSVIILAGFHLYWDYGTVLFNHKIQLALFLAVKIIEVEPVGRQLLRNGVLVNGTEVDAFGIGE